jgi:hypothetical protein
MKIFIPEPCHENWNKMTTTQKGRFCDACKTEVVDFTKMSKHEIQHYFSSNCNTKVCGKYKASHVSIDKSSSILTKLKYFAIVSVGLFLPQSCLMGVQKREAPTTEDEAFYDSIQKIDEKATADSLAIKKLKKQ